jgi:hypothetical protein
VDQGKKGSQEELVAMRYYVTIEEVQWAMKDWPEEWRVPVDSKKGSKGKKASRSWFIAEEK